MMAKEVPLDSKGLRARRETEVLPVLTASQDPLAHLELLEWKVSAGVKVWRDPQARKDQLDLKERKGPKETGEKLENQAATAWTEFQESMEPRVSLALLELLVSEGLWVFRGFRVNQDQSGPLVRRAKLVRREPSDQSDFLGRRVSLENLERMEKQETRGQRVQQENKGL